MDSMGCRGDSPGISHGNPWESVGCHGRFHVLGSHTKPTTYSSIRVSIVRSYGPLYIYDCRRRSLLSNRNLISTAGFRYEGTVIGSEKPSSSEIKNKTTGWCSFVRGQISDLWSVLRYLHSSIRWRYSCRSSGYQMERLYSKSPSATAAIRIPL